MEGKKTFFVVKRWKEYEPGDIIQLTAEEAFLPLHHRLIVPFRSAIRLGLVEKYKKTEKSPKKSLKRRRTRKYKR